MPSSPSDDSTDETDAAPTTSRRRKYGKRRRILLILALLVLVGLPIFLLLLNGPGFRTLGRLAALEWAESTRLDGDLTLEGHLWSDFSISDLSFLPGEDGGLEGETGFGIERLEIGEASIDYRPLGLITGAARLDWLETVRLEEATVHLRLPAPSEEGDPDEKSSSPPGEPSYHPLWNLLDADIAIEDLNLEIRQGDHVYSIEGLGFHTSSDGAGTFQLADVRLPGRDPVGQLAVEWHTDGRSLTVGPIVMDEGARIENLTVAEPSPGAWTLAIDANLGGARLTAELDQRGAVALKLLRGRPLVLEDALPDDLLPRPLDGRITDLDLTFEGDFETPSSWEIDGTVVASALSWDDIGLDSLALRLRQGKLSLEGRRPHASIRFDASLPLQRAESIDDLAALPIDVSAGLKTDSLSSLAASLGAELPLTGAASLRARNVQFFTDGRLSAGSLLLVSEDLAWNGVPLKFSQFAANVKEQDLVHVAGDFGLDEANRLRLTGEMDTAALAYEAEMDGVLSLGDSLFRRLDLELPLPLAGDANLTWTGSGSLETGDHRGEGTLVLDEVRINGGAPIGGEMRAGYEGGTVRLETVDLASGNLRLSGSGGWDGDTFSLSDWKLRADGGERLALDLALPFDRVGPEPDDEGTSDENGETESADPAGEARSLGERIGALETTLTVDQLDLAPVAALFMAEPPRSGAIDGRLAAEGFLADLAAEGNFQFRPTFENAPPDASLTTEFQFDGDVTRPADWQTRFDAVLSGLRWRERDIGDVNLEVQTRDGPRGRTLLGRLEFAQADANFDCRTSLRLAQANSLDALAERPFLADASLAVDDVAPLWKQFAPEKLRGFPISGGLEAEVNGLAIEGGSPRAGRAVLSSDTLAISGQTLAVALDAKVPEPGRLAGNLNVEFDEFSRVEAGGSYQLDGGTYDGRLDLTADLENDGALKKLLGGRNLATLLPKVTHLSWSGSGALEKSIHRGEIDLAADRLALADGAVPIDLRAEGRYEGASAEFPEISLSSSALDVAGAASWRDGRLELTDWKGRSQGREVLSLSASAPLDPEKLTPEAWLPQKTPLALDLSANRLPIDGVARLLLDEPPVRGDLSADLALEGTPALPTLGGTVDFESIALPSDTEDVPLGEFHLQAETADRTLDLAGEYRHPDLEPLSLDAAFPLHPAGWASGDRSIGDEPLKVGAHMDRSSLDFLATRVPLIESIDGVVGIDTEVRGTVDAPEISGSGLLDIARLRFEDRNIPSIRDCSLDVRFTKNRITLERLRAIVAGGVVEGAGSVRFRPGNEPLLDFTVDGSEVLVTRTPDLSVRTDLSLALSGPFSEARLSGEIGLVNSRYFKNFDLLPISMPSGGSSALPEVETSPGGGASPANLDIGVPVEPFADWPLEVRLHTAVPFAIRSNLVQSAIEGDIRLSGTLGEPVPNGYLAIDEGELNLPFSKVDVEIGRVEFDRGTGFNGAVEFKARAKADQYRINIYLHNRLFSPEWVLTSVPPLPSEDIVTLLATGTTRSELIGSDAGTKAASKAAALFFKNLRKVSAAEKEGSDLLDELQKRTELDVGGVNPETGEHTFGGKIRLWKQLFFVGDVTQESDYRALLKYVFRFR